MAEEQKAAETTRREVLQKAAFVAPVVLSLAAVPSFASVGSGNEEKDKKRRRRRKRERTEARVPRPFATDRGRYARLVSVRAHQPRDGSRLQPSRSRLPEDFPGDSSSSQTIPNVRSLTIRSNGRPSTTWRSMTA